LRELLAYAHSAVAPKLNAKPTGVVRTDSCSSLVSALGATLTRAGLQSPPAWTVPVQVGAETLQRLPYAAVASLYRFGAWWEGAPLRTACKLDPDAIARWLVANSS